MDIKIKKAEIENLKDIQKLNLMLFEKEKEEFDPTLNCNWTFSKEGIEYFEEKITKNDSCAFVAVLEGKVIGYLVGGLTESESHRNNVSMAELENMFVLEEFRSKSIGKDLYFKFLEWCNLKSVKRIMVVASAQNKKAIEFYRKQGFNDYDLTLEMNIN